jgi:hypothetical protein
MKLWQRAVVVIASVAALHALWRFPTTGLSSVLIGVAFIWFGRSLYRRKFTPNPMGDGRDYSLRPVAVAALKSVGSFVAAALWAVLIGYASRRNILPDTSVAVGLAVAPLFVLLMMMVIYLAKAITRFQFGTQRDEGGRK